MGLIFVILGLASKISIIPLQTRVEGCDKQAPVPVTHFSFGWTENCRLEFIDSILGGPLVVLI
jgi:hypothetical protein